MQVYLSAAEERQERMFYSVLPARLLRYIHGLLKGGSLGPTSVITLSNKLIIIILYYVRKTA